MGLQINNNVAAFNAYRNLSSTQGSLSKNLEKLSSGFRINRAADDAAGLAISEGLRSQIGGLTQAARNAQDGVSVVQTAEGALTEVHSMLQRVRDLSVQAANDSNDTDSRAAIQKEISQLGGAIEDIATRTSFNGTKLLDGSTPTMSFQVGANENDTLTVNLSDISAVADAVKGITITDGASAGAAITAIDAQIKAVSTTRADLGAAQNRFEHTINSLNVSVENLTASESRIRDTDMASEMTQFSKNQILSQAGTAMLAQANQLPQGVLKLLG